MIIIVSVLLYFGYCFVSGALYGQLINKLPYGVYMIGLTVLVFCNAMGGFLLLPFLHWLGIY